ncbi:MAG: energy transducer TonB [Gammaproteobacteria bacterium]|nr:energy transducer TonB [Gammaproteobacteria bacterium]
MSLRHHSKKRAILGTGGATLIAFAALAYGFKIPSVDVPAAAPEIASDTASLERYSPPRVLSKAAARYPRNALRKRREGWVRLHFMVDTSGRPYEIAVTDSVGDRVFQEAAVEALEESTFDPARLDGNPIDAGHSIHYNFERRRDARPRRWFARTHKLAMRAIEAEDREEADRLLGQLSSVSDRNWSIRTLGVQNLVEDAYFHVAKYAYFAKWGDQRQQLDALDRAVHHVAPGQRTPELLYVSMHRVRFQLLVETRDYQRAIETYEKLAEHPVEEAVLTPMRETVEQLETLRLDGRAYSVPGDFGDRFTWTFSLFKDEFLFEDVAGRVEEIKLRCAKKYLFHRFLPDIRYRVDQSFHPCHMQLIGDPGTTFTLTQL